MGALSFGVDICQSGSRDFHGKGAFIMKIATVELNLAKTLFQVHEVDSQGHIVVRKQLRHADVLSVFAKLEPCVVGMEVGCSGRYARLRRLQSVAGTTPYAMPP